MAPSSLSVDTQLLQLGEARNLVLRDPGYWPQVLHGTLPIIAGPVLEVRRWGAEFMAETFSTPVVDARGKQELALPCLDTMLRLLSENETEILKGVLQCSASVYPIIFRHLCSNRNDADTWNKMVAIKSKILNLWDVAPTSVRICCIKFVQRVILVQSRGITDPRLMDRSEVNLLSVPANHPLLPLSSLDAEAQGLLDRLLSIFHEKRSEPILIAATLNNLAPLVKTRPPLAQKVIAAVLAFNPFAEIPPSISIHDRLMIISIEKTVRALLLNIVRNNPQGSNIGRISQQVARLSQAKSEMNESFSRKRAATSQETEAAKRPKMDKAALQNTTSSITTPSSPPPAATPSINSMPQIVPRPLTYANLYTLATDPAMISFDGQQLPLDLVLPIVIGSMYSVDQNNFHAAIAAVQARYNASLASPLPPPSIPVPAAHESYTTCVNSTLAVTIPTVQKELPERLTVVKQDKQETEEEEQEAHDEEIQIQLGEFQLPPPQRLSTEQSQHVSLEAMERMFGVIDAFETNSLISRKSRLGVNRLAASNWDREGWIAILIRMATRGCHDNNALEAEHGRSRCLAVAVRERLYNYVIQDFRRRMDVAVAWLNEEWYNDMVKNRSQVGILREPQYHKWMMKVIDSIFPFLEAKDRLFMRMLSEIPEIPPELLCKVKMLCLDPDRTNLGIQMLHYLAMFRPPVREICVDVLQDLWLNHREVRSQVHKLVQKWRPAVLVEMKNHAGQQTETTMNGDGAAVAASNA
ncbi:hypothetical protein K440DRAFT_591226 [Wilcoxina mikolae CBS 423.85]|nr:hypothetical protein K440DRAFT_591226 [Wilcoxina mikolae CBS 423.85]